MQDSYNLVLTGFMGVGKSTIGEVVAARLGRSFVDTDQIIMDRLGKSVAEIFEAYGEPFFRALEASVCTELGEPKGLVISTGGGALTRWDNLKNIAGQGNIVICLTASPDIILERLKNDKRKRPLIDNTPDHNRKAAIVSLLQTRQAAYDRIRLRLDTSHKTNLEVVDEVLNIFEYEVGRNHMRLPVYSPTNRYTILVENGLINTLGAELDAYNLRARTVVAADANVAPLYGEKIAQSLPNAALVTMPAGERHKNLATVEKLYRDFAAAGLDRAGVVIALGGGVVGDTIGFAAATYMRGVPLVQMPTSLLAMVDSSVGGKVGVDIPEGKNLVGSFKQPELVIIDPDVLKTLPDVEIRCGLAEAIKHGLLADPELLNHLDQIAAGNAALLRRVIQVKVDVVQRDPYEQAERANLNLGHTFAHAVERVSGYAWPHGEAVGLGLVAAARLSEKLGALPADQTQQITEIVGRVGLPTSLNGFDPQQVWEAMFTDKKWRAGHSHFVILEGIGNPRSVHDVPRDVVIDVLESLSAQ